MSTFTQIYYHLVFSTKNREPVLLAAHREALFRYMWGIIKNNNSHLYRINGVEDHVHILTSLHPSVCLADFVKTVKISASQWMKGEGVCPDFSHWQDGYGAFTHSHGEKNALIAYIRGQEEHHKKKTFADELRQLLVDAGVGFDERYLVNPREFHPRLFTFFPFGEIAGTDPGVFGEVAGTDPWAFGEVAMRIIRDCRH